LLKDFVKNPNSTGNEIGAAGVYEVVLFGVFKTFFGADIAAEQFPANGGCIALFKSFYKIPDKLSRFLFCFLVIRGYPAIFQSNNQQGPGDSPACQTQTAHPAAEAVGDFQRGIFIEVQFLAKSGKNSLRAGKALIENSFGLFLIIHNLWDTTENTEFAENIPGAGVVICVYQSSSVCICVNPVVKAFSYFLISLPFTPRLF